MVIFCLFFGVFLFLKVELSENINGNDLIIMFYGFGKIKRMLYSCQRSRNTCSAQYYLVVNIETLNGMFFGQPLQLH